MNAAPSPWLRGAVNLAAAALLFMQGAKLAPDLLPAVAKGEVNDFYQEWASAKNYFAGWPIYEHQGESARRWLGLRYIDIRIRHNAHPPTSVLFALPFAALGYIEATALWQALTLLMFLFAGVLFVRELKLPFPPWLWLPAAAGLALFDPFIQQMRNGQLNGVLLLLLVLIWRADRRGRGWEAGLWLGLAMGVKLFPGFLLLYFLLRKRWDAIAIAAATFLALTGFALLLFGKQAFAEYVEVVLPFVSGFRCHWYNIALNGIWSRSFLGSEREAVIPLLHSPLLAGAGLWVSLAALVLATAWATRQAKTPTEFDAAFGLNLTAMLLVAPLTWNHSLVLLLPWLFCLRRQTPARIIPQCALAAIVLGLAVDSMNLARPFIRPQLPIESGPTLALLGQKTATALAPTAVSPAADAALELCRVRFAPPLVILPQGTELMLAVNLPGYLLLALWGLQLAWLKDPAPTGTPA